MNRALDPGRRGGTAQEDDGEPFEDKMKRLVAEIRVQQTDAAKLDDTIAGNLEELKCGR